jgi:hypothetical protein
MPTLVYLLCALTSTACAVLLLRGYRRSHARLLFWSGLCFVGLALNNVLVFVDERIVPATDLSAWRTLPALLGIGLLIYGLVWEVR